MLYVPGYANVTREEDTTETPLDFESVLFKVTAFTAEELAVV
jgi:hypothetical protein